MFKQLRKYNYYYSTGINKSMNIDKKLDEMEPKDTPLLVLGYIILGMCLLIPLTASANDNVVLLDQSGDVETFVVCC